jgi:hypothetical protein
LHCRFWLRSPDCRAGRCAVSTVFERKIKLNVWVRAVDPASKKGFSAYQLHCTLDVTYKTIWFMAMRIREAMHDKTPPPMGGEGKIIESDETFIGRLDGQPKRKDGYAHKKLVLTLVERGGSARSFHIDSTSIASIPPIIRMNARRQSMFMTDEARRYKEIGREFAGHDAVNHGKDEYVRYESERMISTNTVEGYYSIFKRGMKGVYQHCSEKHLQRYLAEFDFRYSNRAKLGVSDAMRSNKAMQGIVGKRLMYRRPRSAEIN